MPGPGPDAAAARAALGLGLGLGWAVVFVAGALAAATTAGAVRNETLPALASPTPVADSATVDTLILTIAPAVRAWSG